MSKTRIAVLVLASLLIVTSCAGRKPNPVQTAQVGDDLLSCVALEEEAKRNQARIIELGNEKGDKVAQNVAAGVAGVFLILPFFLMDFQNAPGVEQEALFRRQYRIRDIARSRGCDFEFHDPRNGPPPKPVPPGQRPNCADVGGYEAYMLKTGKVCRL